MTNATVVLPDDWAMLPPVTATDDWLGLVAGQDELLREVLGETLRRLSDRHVGFVAMRRHETADGLVPTGVMALSLDDAGAPELEALSAAIGEAFDDVAVRDLDGVDHLVVTSTEDGRVVRGHFRPLPDRGSTMLLWTSLTLVDAIEAELAVLDAIAATIEVHETPSNRGPSPAAPEAPT